MNNLNSFPLQAFGVLARSPELVTKESTTFVRFCLVGANYTYDENGAERAVTSHVWFQAFDDVAHDLIKHAKKGDQLIIQALVCGSTVVQDWYSVQQVQFFVTAFEFGARARNGGPSSAQQTAKAPPQSPPDGQTEETAIAVA